MKTKTGFAPQTELTQSEKLYSLLLETHLIGKDAQLAAVWNEAEGITHRLFYDGSLECFLFGKEPTFSHEDFMPMEGPLAEFYLSEYDSKEQFLKSTLLAWESEVGSVTQLNNASVQRSDIRTLAEAIFKGGTKVLDTWREEVPGGDLAIVSLSVSDDLSELQITSDRSDERIVVVNMVTSFTQNTVRDRLTEYVNAWYDVSPNKRGPANATDRNSNLPK